jgi:hypothetical protein
MALEDILGFGLRRFVAGIVREKGYLLAGRAREVKAAVNGHRNPLNALKAAVNAQHQGVGVIITNEDRTQFYFQDKGDSYPIRQYKNCLSFFGGRLDKINGEGIDGALKRELQEPSELGDYWGNIVYDVAEELETIKVKDGLGNYNITIYEAVLSNDKFDELVAAPTGSEGIGIVVPRENLLRHKYIWGLERVLHSYLTEHLDEEIPQMQSHCALQHGIY